MREFAPFVAAAAGAVRASSAGGATRSTSGCGGVRGGFGVRRRVPAAFRGFSQVDGRNGVYREEVEAEPSVAQLPDRVMRRRNAVAYMRSYVILNFSVLATAPPVSAIDLPSAATV